MKTKLLFILSFFSIMSWAQSIPAFHGVDNSFFNVFTTLTPLDQSASGANQSWTFGSFLSLGGNTYNYTAPTAPEVTTYPGTTEVTLSSSGTKMFTKTATGNIFSITGLAATDLNINFSTNNATLGAFPMVYGFSNTDSVAGNYVYTTYSGNFTGTLVTSVDAYGTLTLTDAAYAYTGNVIRLKTVLNLSLTYIFPNAATVTQTSYMYYDTNSATFIENPIFRSITTHTVSSLLSLDQTDTTLEKFEAVLLKNPTHALDSVWVENPVLNNVKINSASTMEPIDISIADLLGKIVYTSKNNSISGTLELPVNLNKGMYMITLSNEIASITKKIIKN
jgi:hypothetical protein